MTTIPRNFRKRSESGAALILVLVTIAIVSLLAAGIASLVISHLGRTRRDQDAAKALNLAEAALTYQVQRITSVGLTGSQVKYNGSNPTTASYGAAPLGVGPASWFPVPTWSTTAGAFRPLPIPADLITVGTKNLHPYLNLNNVNTGTGTGDVWVAWATPDINLYDNTGQYLYGAATVNGVTRVVRGKGGATGIFDRNALFSMGNIDFGGNLTVNGVMGTNGSSSIGGTADVDGLEIYGGGTATGGSPPPPVTYYPNKLTWPTITSIANGVAIALQAYTGADKPSYTASLPTTQGILNFGPTGKNDNAWGTSLATTGSNPTAVPLAASGSVDTSKNIIRLVGKPWGANYYLDNLNGTVDIAADIASGPVNLWINSNEAGQINIGGTSRIRAYRSMADPINPVALPANPTISSALLKLADAAKFRIYYRNTKTGAVLRFLGLNDWYAMFYSYDVVGAQSMSSVQFGGNSVYNGSLIVYDLQTSQGGPTINFPANNGLEPGEGLLFYGVQREWHEVNPPKGY